MRLQYTEGYVRHVSIENEKMSVMMSVGSAEDMKEKVSVESYNLVCIGRTDPIHIMFVVCFGDIFLTRKYQSAQCGDIMWHQPSETNLLRCCPEADRS